MLHRRPKRAAGENPILRAHFVHELAAHDNAADLAGFLDAIAASLEPVPWRPVPDPTFPDIASSSLARPSLTPLGRLYFRAWLRSHGINPDTGTATLDGYAFLREVLDPHPEM